MTDKFSDDRLSAWLDDELSIEDRAEFEEQLEADPELRQRLEELGQVSGLIRELPKTRAPEELKPSIMRAIERDTLLPAGGELTRSQRGRQRATIAVAAVVVLAGAAIWQMGQNDDPVADNSAGDSGGPRVATMERKASAALANRIQQRPNNDWINGAKPGLRIHRDDLNSARVGDIVHAFEADGDAVSIIRMTVVDVKSSVEALQVLLTREQIPTDENGQPVETEDGLLAVFVESHPDDLKRAMQRLASSVEFDSLELSNPVSIADLEPDVKSQLGLAGDKSEPGQRTVMLKPGTQLDKAVRKAPGAADEPEPSAGNKAVDSDTKKPVRVIFVMTREASETSG